MNYEVSEDQNVCTHPRSPLNTASDTTRKSNYPEWTRSRCRQPTQLKGREAVGGHNFVTSGWVSEPRMKQVAADSVIIMTQVTSLKSKCGSLGKGDGEILAAHGLKQRGYGLRAREERSCTDGSKSWLPPAMKTLEVRPVAEMGLPSSAMKKWRIDTATSQLVHRSLDRDQFLGVLIAAEYRPAVASTYVSSVRSSKGAD
ncbi:hypothetical protein HPB52_016013 [Rhipicephalus sanguineus]|uniref:Uncharacterized protein n=1 Tax=Rhipicephalus sanguineus TaxID=34632 RepID=A0A9D4Q7B5_RHISA|nr:hypothetical protein HPB52_016013 [Rhipicephalus sanguineus]